MGNKTVTTTTPAPDAAHIAKVAHTLAYESATLGAASGTITARMTAIIYVAKAWELPKSENVTLDAYLKAGGAEGTYRVARRMAGLLIKPVVSQAGVKSFREACEKAHGGDSVASEVSSVVAAFVAYKGDTGWQNFADALAGKEKAAKATSKPLDRSIDTSKAIEAALNGEGDAETAGQVAADAVVSAENAKVSDIETKVLSYIEHCSMTQLKNVQDAIDARVASTEADSDVADAA